MPATSTGPRATIVPLTVVPAGMVRAPGRDAVGGGKSADLLALGELLEGLADVARAARLRREGGGEQRGHECDGGAKRRAHPRLAATSRREPPKCQQWYRPPSPRKPRTSRVTPSVPERLDGRDGGLAEQRERQVARRADTSACDAVGEQAGGEDGRVAAAGQPDHGDGEQAGDGGADAPPPRRGAGRRLREPARHRVAGGHVGRHEDGHLRHDPIGEPGVRGEVGERLEGVHDDPRVVEPRATLVAFGDMRTKRGDAESGLAVDQKVDLVGEQVSVIHDSSGPSYGTRGC